MKHRRLLAIDIDGTFVDSQGNVPASARKALVRLRQAGVDPVFATGRQYRSCRDIIQSVAPGAPAIVHSGAIIKDTASDETLHTTALDEKVALTVAGDVVDAGLTPLVMMDGFSRGVDFLTLRTASPTAGHARFIDLNRAFGLFEMRLPDTLPAPATQVLALGDREELASLYERLCRDALEAELRLIHAPAYSLYALEAFPRGVDKWTAVSWLASRIKVSPADIAAVGDDTNDVQLLSHAGFGVAMGSAPEEVRNAADALVATSDHDGFAQAVAAVLSHWECGRP